MLRTYTLTLSATDAIAGFPGACPNQVVIEHFRTVIFFIQPCGIECPENVGSVPFLFSPSLTGNSHFGIFLKRIVCFLRIIVNFPDYFCRYTSNNAVVRDIFRHHGSGSNYYVVSNRHARHNRAVPSDPHIPANGNRFCLPDMPRLFRGENGWLTVAISVFGPIIT